MPAQHVWLCDLDTRDRFIIGHVMGMFKQVARCVAVWAHR